MVIHTCDGHTPFSPIREDVAMMAEKAPGQKAHLLAKVVSVPRRRDGVHVVLQILHPGVLVAEHTYVVYA